MSKKEVQTSQSNLEDGWIVLVAGGSGGHVVPAKNIATELLGQDPKARILLITNKGYYERALEIFASLGAKYPEQIEIRRITSGKFRRYGRGNKLELTDIRTQLLNLRDLFKMIIGVLQSRLILMKFKPSVVLCKGGSGSLEFCYAARKKAPIIVHDSDSRPGLANSLVARWAEQTLTGMPTSSENVGDENMVGIPVNQDFRVLSAKEVKALKATLRIDQESKTVLVTGGSLGAHKMNELIFCTINDLNKLGIQVLHQVGSTESLKRAKTIKKELKNPKLYRPFAFSNEMPSLYGVSDAVVARAGATTIQELANSAKPAIIIPAGLTDQKKNARILNELGAAVVSDQDELLKKPEEFISQVQFLLEDHGFRESLAKGISMLSNPDSGAKIVERILEVRIKE